MALPTLTGEVTTDTSAVLKEFQALPIETSLQRWHIKDMNDSSIRLLSWCLVFFRSIVHDLQSTCRKCLPSWPLCSPNWTSSGPTTQHDSAANGAVP